MVIRTQFGLEKGGGTRGTLYETVLLVIFGKKGFCTIGETIRRKNGITRRNLTRCKKNPFRVSKFQK